MKGFIILPREFVSDERLDSGEPFDRSRAFIDLLMHATHKERTLTFRGNEILLAPGELVTSIRTLCRRWHRSLGYVNRTLRKLSDAGLVFRKAGNKITVLKITDWQKYQGYFYLKQNTPGTEDNNVRDTQIKQNTGEAKYLENAAKTKETSPLREYSGHQSDTVFGTPEPENRDNIQKCILKENKYASAEASSLASFFLSEIREKDPYIKPPDLPKWSFQLGRMIVEDQIPPGELRRMIEFSQRNPGWSRLVVSPYKLKVHFHKIFIDMKLEEKKKNRLVPLSQRFCFEE